MSVQFACDPLAKTAEHVGGTFVQRYYSTLNESPEFVIQYYKDTSFLSWTDPNGGAMVVSSLKSINDRICSMGYKAVKYDITDARYYEDAVFVDVSGTLKGKDQLTRKFKQFFTLSPEDGNHYVSGDILHIEENVLAAETERQPLHSVPEVQVSKTSASIASDDATNIQF